MTEDEVRVFAEGVGLMIGNAWKMHAEAWKATNPDLEAFYREQAGAQGKVLKLLERVLTGEYRGPDA